MSESRVTEQDREAARQLLWELDLQTDADMRLALTGCALAAARQAAEQERDKARRIARDHHLIGGCLTCMANESEKIAAEQRAERLAVLLKAADSWVFEGTMLHQQILSALEREDAARGEQHK